MAWYERLFVILALALIAFFSIGAVWMNLFPEWDPREALAKLRERK